MSISVRISCPLSFRPKTRTEMVSVRHTETVQRIGETRMKRRGPFTTFISVYMKDLIYSEIILLPNP